MAFAALIVFLSSNRSHTVPVRAAPLRAGPIPSAALYSLTAQGRAASASPGADWHAQAEALYAALGDPDAALAHQAASAVLSDNPAQWHSVAARFFERAEWDAARQAWEAVLRLSPGDALAHYQLGVMNAPNDPRAAYEHLTAASVDSAFADAARAIQETIAATQVENPAYQSAAMGITLASLDHWPQAEQAFDMAAALDPSYAEAWAYLALARAQQGKDARDALAQAEALAPQDALVAYLRGLTYRAGGDYARSREALEMAQRLEPQNPAFAAELGETFRQEGFLALAEQGFQTAASLSPGENTFLNLLALFYADTLYNLDGGGLAALEEAAARDPSSAAIQAAYGWVLFNLGETDAALDAVNAALALEPDHPRALYALGLIEQAQGRRDQAVAALLRLLDHPDPQGFDVLARRALENFGYR